MKHNFYVYIYQNEDHVPIYVGKGSWNRIDRHVSIVKRKIAKKQKMGTHFYNFLAKMLMQNKEPLRFISQDNLTEEEAHKLEIYLIKLFGRKDCNTGCLLNHTDGGEGSSGLKWSEESRANKSGEHHPYYNKGYLITGEKNGFYGKRHTIEWKRRRKATIGDVLRKSEKFREYCKRTKETGARKGEKRSEETKRRMSEARKEFLKNVSISQTKVAVK